MRVAIVHDYLTQRGGAERVVLAMRNVFPDAPIYTSFYDPASTFEAFSGTDVRTLPIDHLTSLRRHHRLAFPLLGKSFDGLKVDADVALCSSSGWAHGAHVRGEKVVYCHAPARWLYQTDRYLSASGPVVRAAFRLFRPQLLRWDARAAASARCYIANSTATRDLIRVAYGIDAEVVPPPFTIDPTGAQETVAAVEPGFILCVARLMPYKNVDAVVAAFGRRPRSKLIVVGTGPQERVLRGAATPNVDFRSVVTDEELRWLYANCAGLVAASYEDFGLTPVEAATFGRPTAALRFGGFLDTVLEGETGVFFGDPSATAIATALDTLQQTSWNVDVIRRHAQQFDERHFADKLRNIVSGVEPT